MLAALSLLLAVTTVAQDSVSTPSTPGTRRHRTFHGPVTAIAPMVSFSAAPMTVLGLDELSGLSSLAGLASLASLGDIAPIAAIDAVPAIGDVFGFTDDDEDIEPRWPQDEQGAQADVADSLYRAARQALSSGQYTRAADLFKGVRDRYPRSTYVPNTYYWQAFALYRSGSDDALRAARDALRTQARQFPKATTHRDADVLLRRVQGELGRRGDEEGVRAIAADVDAIAPPQGGGVVAGSHRSSSRSSRDCDDEDDTRIAAMNALLQMDAERAIPLLKTVLARRDEGSVCLRRKAVFLVSQKRTDETSRILLDAVRSDPDQEVREQGVFWLSQVPGDESVAALDSILRASTDTDIQEKAIFALSQHNGARAGGILRAFAERNDANPDLREKAIFWLGQNRSPDNAQFLKDLYKKLNNDDLKEKVIFSLSQMGGTDNYRWLMDIALDTHEDIELRKKALFWAGQGNSVDVADLVRLYDSMNDREMKEQLIFVYSQRREDAALEKLFQIGRNDPDSELRKKAIFWVGQSRSPKAAQFLQELINQ
jgi:hypothetical protein